VYEILARHISEGCDNIELHTILNDVYKVLAINENDITARLDELEQKGAISNEDNLMLTVLLAVSRIIGPDLNFLRQAIMTGDFDVDKANSLIVATELDASIISYLQENLSKING
jgi:hypothetical protein